MDNSIINCYQTRYISILVLYNEHVNANLYIANAMA
jgi:hypothetical protein